MTLTYVRWNNPYTSPPDAMPKTLGIFPGLPGTKDRTHPAVLLIELWRARGVFGYGLHLDLWHDAPPRRQMSEAAKIKLRKGNAMRRFHKRYGFTAEHFLAELYAQKGWTWTEEDDRLWVRAQLPPKQSKVQKLKQAKRKSENDELLKGTP